MNIAFCIFYYGTDLPDISDQLKRISLYADIYGCFTCEHHSLDLSLFNDISISSFSSPNQSLFWNLHKVSMLKRKYEIENHFNYSMCIASSCYEISNFLTPPKVQVQRKTIYTNNTGTLPDWNVPHGHFLGDSLTFDKACDYVNYQSEFVCDASNPNFEKHDAQLFHYLNSLFIDVEEYK